MTLSVLLCGAAPAGERSGGAERAPSHVVELESGRVLPGSAVSLSSSSRLLRTTRELSRQEVVYSDLGEGLRLGVGLGSEVEGRGKVHWLTDSGSGHSGQFDSELGIKVHALGYDTGKLRVWGSGLVLFGGIKS